MKINSNYIVHQVASEHIIMLKSKKGNEMTKVASLNETSVWLWNELIDKEFDEENIVQLLISRYEIDENTANKDAKKWIKTLKDNDLIA